MKRVLAALAALAIAGAAQAETYRLQYRAAILGGVEIGEARYEVTSRQQRYAVRSTLRTSGAARIFDQTEITASAIGTVTRSGIIWSRYDLSHAYSGKFRRVRLNRAAGIVSSDISPRYGNMGNPATTTRQQTNSYDPLSGLFALGRQVGTAHACTGSVFIFDGRGHYRLSLSAKSQSNFNGGGYRGPALVCNMRYQPIAGFTFSAQQVAQIPTAEAWFALPAQGGFAPPLRLTVPTPVGAARLDLSGYQALDSSPTS